MKRQSAHALLLIAGAAATTAMAQPTMLWVRQAGTNALEMAYAASPDGKGGAFLCGTTQGNLDGPNQGGDDVVLMRYDRDGHQLALKQFGTGSFDRAAALASDVSGGVFVAGSTGAGIGGPNVGGYDGFVARYDGAGNRAWAVQIGSPMDDAAAALASDGAGGCFVAGSTLGDLGAFNAGGVDVFLARYDADGNQEWITQFGTAADETVGGLAPDGAGGVIVTGVTYGSLGAPGAGQGDIYLVRFDGAGGEVWTTQFGSGATDLAAAVVEDGAGGVILAGSTEGNLGGPNAGSFDAYVARCNNRGDLEWIQQFGTDDEDKAVALLQDGIGGAIVSGFTLGGLGGPENGSYDAFLAAYAADGGRRWATQFGTGSGDIPAGLASDGEDGSFVAGYTYGNLGGPQHGAGDIFLARFAAPCYPDCDTSGVLDLFDFLCFVNNFDLGGWVYADCDHNDSLDLFDFLCFVNQFNAGC